MTISLNLQDVHGDVPAADRAWIMATLETVRDRACDRLDLRSGDVNVMVAPRMVIPEYGIGGWTYNRSVSQIVLDPWSPRFKEPERVERLGATLAHELHHLARLRHPAAGWTPRTGARATLGHALITEGLAQSFEEEMGFSCPFYATAVQGSALWDLAAKALADFETPEFDYDAWFFGRQGEASYPRLGGYALGYAIVRGWMMTAETAPSEELGLEAREVLSAWRTGRLDI